MKLATYPLTKKQMASTIALQALQPQVKAIQERLKGRPPEEAQVEVARLYKEAGVNPLAGCLPTLVTLPVWIGLYRALSNVADEGLLKEGWFWIPSLAGPTSLAAQKAGSGTSWLFPFVDGAPPIGWSAASSYLILPVLLVVSQAVTQKLMAPPTPPEGADSSTQSTQAILKFLPLMIGWFSLNVPAGLTLYWFTNNLLSTAQQAYLKKTLTPALAGAGGAGTGGASSSSFSGGGANAAQRGPVVQAEATPARATGKRNGENGESGARARPRWPERRGEERDSLSLSLSLRTFTITPRPPFLIGRVPFGYTRVRQRTPRGFFSVSPPPARGRGLFLTRLWIWRGPPTYTHTRTLSSHTPPPSILSQARTSTPGGRRSSWTRAARSSGR